MRQFRICAVLCGISEGDAGLGLYGGGLSAGGAAEETVRLMKKTVGSAMGVKASGGIRSLEDAQRMARAGADRLGASCGVQIAEQILSSGDNS